jgi:hypothetical protein
MYDIVNGFVLCFLCAFRDLAPTRGYLVGFGRGRALKFVAYKVLVFVVGAAMASVAGVNRRLTAKNQELQTKNQRAPERFTLGLFKGTRYALRSS